MLHVLPVDRLRRPGDLFRCAPYDVTLSAKACVARRAKLAERDAPGHRGALDGVKETQDLTLCRGCAQGAAVDAQLEPKKKVPVKPKPEVPEVPEVVDAMKPFFQFATMLRVISNRELSLDEVAAVYERIKNNYHADAVCHLVAAAAAMEAKP